MTLTSISKKLYGPEKISEHAEIFKEQSDDIDNNWNTDRHNIISAVKFIFYFILLYFAKIPETVIYVIGENEELTSMHHRQT
jgi:hypothetical protein